MQPQVQSLDQIIAELNPAYAKQEQLLGSQRSGLGLKYDSQRSALGAEKTQGFNQINNQATGRGLSFSGIPLDEQATYLSTKYLPGMQGLASQQNQEDMSLQQALAQIDTQRRTRALDTRQQQQSSLEKYLADERDRQFQAEQNRLEREASARQAAASRASSQAAVPKLVKNKAGGWEVEGGDMDLAGYSRATGKDLITLLSQGDAKDRQAAKYYQDNIRLGRGEAYAMDRLMNYDRPTAFYRGG